MEDTILSGLEIGDFLRELELHGATWKRRILPSHEGEVMIQIYDILTVDDVRELNLDRMTNEELAAFLPRLQELADNIDATGFDEDEFSEDELEEIRADLDDGLDVVEEMIGLVKRRLGHQ